LPSSTCQYFCALHHTIYVNGFIGETDAEAIAQAQCVPGKFSLDHIRMRGLVGASETIAKRLREIEQNGVGEVIVFLHDIASIEPLRLLAQAMRQQGN
jgi:alkanesulfonate monooxygenase SsuD/methylene tetrahydromethanopterin reductase-like flavin-dependent oxidoreductase (luciferase family)